MACAKIYRMPRKFYGFRIRKILLPNTGTHEMFNLRTTQSPAPIKRMTKIGKLYPLKPSPGRRVKKKSYGIPSDYAGISLLTSVSDLDLRPDPHPK
jgi:hypothetical protein